jgi:hypothetical protein
VRTSPTFFVFALHASFAIEKLHRSGVLTEMTFRSTVPGYLHLETSKQVHGDNFETVLRDSETYSILGGWYLSPWSRSILEDNAIDGLILDTTWHVLRQYVTALIMAVYCKVGVPLGFSFGVAETVELYQQQYTSFAEVFAIDLR